ncbi:protein BREAST CANCER SUSCEPTIBILITY 1 homolog isoform X2 [Vigna unguiculata]|uniref:BRCA1-associated n=1 Tax=Vigna unguiculata TaxID=3917 RepID=A0A4D6KPC8_VIGUN|nr:protein BREAST CANCER SUSCEPTIBILITY 1 homolog isoform X2 [Vigna unguiculata]QCD76959.1 BRCA1-associated [Vigna unguiculata]
MGDLERMGRELKCPICWSLFDSAVSLTCNHHFCNSCIVKSMKSASACPVCKIPFTRREVRPAPHMDNLVNIYKNMEVASGINIFVTQNVSQAKLSDVEKQCDGNADSGTVEAGGSHKGHVQEKKTRKIKKAKKTVQANMESSGSGLSKPSFPAKKRVLVPQNILSETPMKNLKLGDSLSEINKEKEGVEKVCVIESERPLQNEKSVPVLSPFFWLREEKDGEKSSQPTDEDQFIDGSTPNRPSFSDLKDSDDENTSNIAPFDERQNQISVNLFDSEMFEWTQRPCSPELFSSPSKMQVMDTYEDDENQDELVAALQQDLDANIPSTNPDNMKFENPKGNKAADALPPNVTPLIRSSVDINGKVKSRKRGRKAREKIRHEQIVEPKNSIDGMHVDGHVSLDVTQERALGYKPKSSNLGKVSRRSKRVCLNTSSVPTCTSACTVPDTSGVLSINEMEMVANSCISPCKEENQKHCPLKIAGKSQKIISGKQNMDPTAELAGSDSPLFSLQTNSNVNTSKSNRNIFSRKSKSGSKKSRNTKRSKLSSECTSITRNAEEILPNESVHHCPQVSHLNDTSKEKHRSLSDKAVLRKCESHVKKYQCFFCLSSEESEVSGPMVHYLDGKPVPADYEGGFKVTHCHRNCTEWAPNVYFDGENAINLEAEINRSRRIKCSFCGLKGAALGCYEKSCRRSFHVPCAKWTSLCRWDKQNFVMLCPLHSSSMLPCEDSGSQKRSKKGQGRDGKNHGPSLDTISQTRADHRSYKKIVLCCSALSVQEKDIVSKFESVYKVTVLKNWDSSVTHVIASTDENGACRRTLKVLLGILEGKWILKVEWIKACMKEMNPVGEEHYEINVDIHGIRDGPRLGRLRVLNKQPKLFDGYKFYFMGDFIPSYKGYLQELVVAAGGIILHRKPVSCDQKSMLPDTHSYQTFIVYSLELPDKCKPSETDTICRQRCHDAEVVASSTGSKVVTNTWILNSIAACKVECLAQ